MNTILQSVTSQQSDINTLLLMVMTILMIGRGIDRYFDGRNK